MPCLKCGGLTIEERCNDFFNPFTLVRCLVCGFSLDRQIYRNRQLSASRGVDMPKFLNEENKQKWVAAVRAAKEAKKKQSMAMDDAAEQVVNLVQEHQEDWKTIALSQLYAAREVHVLKLADIDAAIRGITSL